MPLCLLMTGVRWPAVCVTSPLLATPMVKPMSKFLDLVTLSVVWHSPWRKRNELLSLLADIWDNFLLNEGFASSESQPAWLLMTFVHEVAGDASACTLLEGRLFRQPCVVKRFCACGLPWGNGIPAQSTCVSALPRDRAGHEYVCFREGATVENGQKTQPGHRPKASDYTSNPSFLEESLVLLCVERVLKLHVKMCF